MMTSIPKEISWHYDRLRRYCCRLTRPRQAILDVLNRNGRHLSAEEIHKTVSGICPHAGLATVYRNLDLLVRIGLVWKFDAGHHKAMFEIVEPPEEQHHHHLICKRCKKIIDYSDCICGKNDFLQEKERELARRYRFKIENHCVDFYGLCQECQDAE